MLSLVEGVAGGVLGAVRQEDHIARSPRVVILVGPGQSDMKVYYTALTLGALDILVDTGHWPFGP